jgi:hypothetical protein
MTSKSFWIWIKNLTWLLLIIFNKLKFQAKTYQHTQRVFKIHSERYKRVEVFFYWILWSSWALFSEDVQKYFIWVLHYVSNLFNFITSSSQERDHFLHFYIFALFFFAGVIENFYAVIFLNNINLIDHIIYFLIFFIYEWFYIFLTFFFVIIFLS